MKLQEKSKYWLRGILNFNTWDKCMWGWCIKTPYYTIRIWKKKQNEQHKC